MIFLQHYFSICIWTELEHPFRLMNMHPTETPKPSKEELRKATYATLIRKAATPEANALVDRLVELLEAKEAELGQRTRRRKDAAQAGLRRAVEAFAGDLLLGLRLVENGWVYRSKHNNSFSGQEVTARHFISVVSAFKALGLLEEVSGYDHRLVSPFGKEDNKIQWGRASRYRGTSLFMQVAEEAGVLVQDVGKHFREEAPEEVLVLKTSSTRVGRTKIPSRPMEFAETEQTTKLRENIEFINDFLPGVEIEGGVHRGFYRVFNLGDDPSFNWDKGGRLYSHGDDSYQRLKETDRLKMTINGEPVAEIDIKSSYLTALHGLRGLPMDFDQDPYHLEGFPREVVKDWVLVTLGHSGHHLRWPKPLSDRYLEKTSIKLSETYSIKAIREGMIEKFPVLKTWGEEGPNWADLMFKESEAVIGAMIHLIKVYAIPSLPVHDSLIVPLSEAGRAEEILSSHYQHHCGIWPQVKIDYPKIDPLML